MDLDVSVVVTLPFATVSVGLVYHGPLGDVVSSVLGLGVDTDHVVLEDTITSVVAALEGEGEGSVTVVDKQPFTHV